MQERSESEIHMIESLEVKRKNEYTKEDKQWLRLQLKEYSANNKCYIMTTRFSNETFEENKKYRDSLSKVKCIYCCPDAIARSIPFETTLFVLEMNNSENKIVGIGKVKNVPKLQKYIVYNENNYNRYQYIGKQRIDRNEMDDEEEEIMQLFDNWCFKGMGHMKRGQGIKSFPLDKLYFHSRFINIHKVIKRMFKKRACTNIVNTSEKES
uniref:Uncharacterized protein n=1 Tax=viral metagenome TaxID=1070528 RepID=A0A6C0AVJ9_9ZZZZ|tara:strand:+ start:6494 stop:7123 length:630 start_codon:yes stop_codon:yes gene_type:complete